MASEKFETIVGIRTDPGTAVADAERVMQEVLSRIEAVGRGGGAFGGLGSQLKRELDEAMRGVFSANLENSPLFRSLTQARRRALQGTFDEASPNRFVAEANQLRAAQLAYERSVTRRVGQTTTPSTGPLAGIKLPAYSDANIKESTIASATARVAAAQSRLDKAIEKDIGAYLKDADRVERETATATGRARRLADANAALQQQVPYPSFDPSTRVGRAQENVNAADLRLASARARLAEVTESESRTATQVFGARIGLQQAESGLKAAEENLRVAYIRAAEEARATAGGPGPASRPGIGQQFALGFKGASDRPFAEQIGQAFKFSVFYGTAYKILFGLTQTFQQTLQEGIQFQQAVTDLALATGKTRDEAEKMAEDFGQYSSPFGFGPSLGAQIGARAQGYYGTTGSSDQIQRLVGEAAARVVSQTAFASGQKPEDIQANLAAVGQAYGLGYQSQQYISDLDAYFSHRFGVQQGNTIDAVAQSGTVGKAAGFSPEEVSAIAAVIQARTGATSSATGGYLAQIFSRAGEGSLTGLAQRYGINQNADFATQFRALADIYRTRPSERDDISAAFGRGKVQNAVIALLNSFDEVQKAAEDARTKAPGSLQTSVDLRLNNIGGQIQELVGQLRDFANALGKSGLLDDLGVLAITTKDVVGGLTEVLNVFNQLPRPVRDVVTALALLSATAKVGAIANREATGGSALSYLFAKPSFTPGAAPAVSGALSAEAAAASETAAALAAEAAAATSAATATGAELAIAEANVAALGSMIATAEAGLEASALRLYGAPGSRAALQDTLNQKRIAGTERLAAVEVEAAAAADAHTAALIRQSEATAAAGTAAAAEAEAQLALATAEAEATAASIAGGKASPGGIITGNLAGLGLTAAAIADFVLINKTSAVRREQAQAGSAYTDYRSNLGDSDLTSAEGQRARAAQAKQIADQLNKATDGRLDRLHNIGDRLFGGQSTADQLRAQKEVAEADQKRAEANAALIEKYSQATVNPRTAAITGFDEESLKSSLDTIARSGGTAKQQFDALAASVGRSGDAAARAAANFHPDVIAAQNADALTAQFIANPAIAIGTKPSAAGEDVNRWFKGASFGLYGGPIDTKDITKEVYSQAFAGGGVQKRLQAALSQITSFADLDPETVKSLASQIVGTGAQDVINASDGKLKASDYDTIQKGLIDQATAFLNNLRDSAVQTGNAVNLTQGELTLLADQALEIGQKAIDDLPQTDYNGRIDQARANVRAIERYIRHTSGGTNNAEAQKDLRDAQNALAEAQFSRFEALRKAAQEDAQSRGEARNVGRHFLVQELRAAAAANDPDLLAQIIGQAGDDAIAIAKKVIREAAAVAQAAQAAEAKSAALVANLAGDYTKPGQQSTANPLQDLLDVLNTTASADDSGNVYTGTGVGPKETAADRSVAAAQANAIRRQGQIAKARADIYAAKVAMDEAKKGSVAYFNALGQLYQAQQELSDAIIAYRQNLYLLGHDITNPLTQARAAVMAAAAQMRADARSGAAPDQLAADRVALQQAQADAESTKFQQRLEAVQTADELGRISHTKYLSYLQHEHDRLEAVKHRTYQQQQELNQIDQLMKQAADAMQGQWNFGDIKLPTPYEIQRRVQEVYGTAVGGTNHSSDPFLPNGAVAPIHGGGQQTNQIFISGADIGAVRKVLKEILGDRATTTTTASRHR